MIDQALEFVLQWEGGFVNDPKDPGGATKYGISFRFLKKQAPELADIDKDGDVDADDIFSLSEEDARRIYRIHFWEALQLHRLPEPIAVAMMDTAVNMGKSRAARILQEALVSLGFNLAVDGIIGPKTRAHAVYALENLLLRQFFLERIWQYLNICNRNRNLRKFLPGWLNRVRDLNKKLTGGTI
jgi:lysozyme family protein